MRIAYLGYVYESINRDIINEGNTFKLSEYDLRRKYDEKSDGLYVTYRVGSRFGINHEHYHPNPLDTPKGIYCYQIHQSYLPYNGGIAIDRNNRDRELSDIENPTTGIIYVLKIRSSANKLDSSKYSESDLEADKVKLTKLIGQELCSLEELNAFISYIPTKSTSKRNLKGTAFGLLWAYTMKYSYVNNSIDTSKWSMLLIKLGYDVVEDHGLGVMHWFEPSQAVFLTPSSYDIIDSTDYGNDDIRQLNKLIELVSKDKDSSNVRKNFRNISYHLMQILYDGRFNSDYDLDTVHRLLNSALKSIPKSSEAYYTALVELKPVFKAIHRLGDTYLEILTDDVSEKAYNVLKDVLTDDEKSFFSKFIDIDDDDNVSSKPTVDSPTIDIKQVNDIFEKIYYLKLLNPDRKSHLIYEIISKYGDSTLKDELNSMIYDISKKIVLDYYRENYPERNLNERTLTARIDITIEDFMLNELDNSEVHRYYPILEKFEETARNILQDNISKIRKLTYSSEANRQLMLRHPKLLKQLNGKKQ